MRQDLLKRPCVAREHDRATVCELRHACVNEKQKLWGFKQQKRGPFKCEGTSSFFKIPHFFCDKGILSAILHEYLSSYPQRGYWSRSFRGSLLFGLLRVALCLWRCVQRAWILRKKRSWVRTCVGGAGGVVPRVEPRVQRSTRVTFLRKFWGPFTFEGTSQFRVFATQEEKKTHSCRQRTSL